MIFFAKYLKYISSLNRHLMAIFILYCWGENAWLDPLPYLVRTYWMDDRQGKRLPRYFSNYFLRNTNNISINIKYSIEEVYSHIMCVTFYLTERIWWNDMKAETGVRQKYLTRYTNIRKCGLQENYCFHLGWTDFCRSNRMGGACPYYVHMMKKLGPNVMRLEGVLCLLKWFFFI